MLGFSEAFEVYAPLGVHSKAHWKCESIVHLLVRLGAALRSKRLGTDEHVGSFPANLSTTQVRVFVIHSNYSTVTLMQIHCVALWFTIINFGGQPIAGYFGLADQYPFPRFPKSWNSLKEFRKHLGIAYQFRVLKLQPVPAEDVSRGEQLQGQKNSKQAIKPDATSRMKFQHVSTISKQLNLSESNWQSFCQLDSDRLVFLQILLGSPLF